MIDEQFVALVNAELQARGWSRSDLARAMGVGPQMVTDYLNGRKKPGSDVIERFFAAFDVEPELRLRPRSVRAS